MNTSKYEAVVEAARKILHWHDAMNGEGMVVSSEAVRELWKALEELDNQTDKELYYAKDIDDPVGGLFGVISVGELGDITSSTTKSKWLRKTKEEWRSTKGIKSSGFDIDYILVPVEEPCYPISGMTEEQSKAISDAMLKMLEEMDWSQPMTFVEA